MKRQYESRVRAVVVACAWSHNSHFNKFIGTVLLEWSSS